MTQRDPFLPPLSDDAPSDRASTRNTAQTGSSPSPPNNPDPAWAADTGAVEQDTADSMASKVQGTIVDAQEKAEQLAETVQDKAEHLGDEAHSMSDRGIDSAAAGLDQAASMLRRQGESHEGTLGAAAAKTADTLDSASSYLQDKDTDQLLSDLEAMVRRRPVESVLAAAGIGFVLSRLLG